MAENRLVRREHGGGVFSIDTGRCQGDDMPHDTAPQQGQVGEASECGNSR